MYAYVKIVLRNTDLTKRPSKINKIKSRNVLCAGNIKRKLCCDYLLYFYLYKIRPLKFV